MYLKNAKKSKDSMAEELICISLFSIFELTHGSTRGKSSNMSTGKQKPQHLRRLPRHADDINRDFLASLLPWSETLPEYIRKPT